MISRRALLGAALAAGATPLRQPRAAIGTALPTATITSFYDALLATMKVGSAIGFAGRSERLAPAIRRAFDLPLMTRLMVGPQWPNLTAGQQEQLVAAFSEFSIATYANRFDDYSGERFEVDPAPSATSNGVIVHSRLIKTDGDAVQIDYLMRDNNAGWQIIDVYLSGTVSELATRRSEFSAVLRRGGADALVDVLQKKAAQLRG
ncbi:MAG TPA: ABC transporter substrate-binding protein [Xanthobacteraceae bacterium]|nr:ABC transporter substrate-binding protein [Xanthobacteraceae bacterium]HXZ00040.1 ABC transporter substrate-binding protein [Stellaceae bacterium]